MNRYQDSSSGPSDGQALLFEMNRLFEDYIKRLLIKSLAGTEWRVTAQGGHRNCLYDGNIGRFRTKPDLLIKRADEIVLVIDTKWKNITAQIHDPKLGVSQSDVYQLMAYSKLYACERVMLLYPHHNRLPIANIRQSYAIADANAKERLSIMTHDLTGHHTSQKQALLRIITQSLENRKP